MTLAKVLPTVRLLSSQEKLKLIQILAEELETAEDVLPLKFSKADNSTWQFLVSRPHSWRQQLYIKGRKLLASTVWQDMIVNSMSPEQAADNWDLPLAAIHEAIQYCQTHQDLVKLEAEEERHRLQEKGVSLEPKSVA
ncbi:MAG: hypothetical protein F6K31_14325 [Symploca sp. SIO2G7]|nr:hypothetical protein [Symploca sp. SIO2G7]